LIPRGAALLPAGALLSILVGLAEAIEVAVTRHALRATFSDAPPC
jgi:hypothetical protein